LRGCGGENNCGFRIEKGISDFGLRIADLKEHFGFRISDCGFERIELGMPIKRVGNCFNIRHFEERSQKGIADFGLRISDLKERIGNADGVDLESPRGCHFEYSHSDEKSVKHFGFRIEDLSRIEDFRLTIYDSRRQSSVYHGGVEA
jgi:hypothetical protein